MPLISIVVPCYNEQESLPIFLKELDGVVRIMTQQDLGISFEVVLIDDGSADKTLAVMKAEAAAAHPYAIRWHSFSRNFGKEAALLAGLQHAKSDYVATITSPHAGPPAKASLPSGRSVPVCSTRSSTAFLRPTSSTEHAILGS